MPKRNDDHILPRRTLLAGGLGTAVMATGGAALAKVKARYYVFSYFRNKDNGAAGMRLAVSDNGLRFTTVRNGESILQPMVGESKLMRDPCVLKDPHRNLYHLVWTTAWQGETIGYASSTDLLNWSEQRAIPVMRNFPGVRNCWAPEIIYDEAADHFVIFWSSTVPSAMKPEEGVAEDKYSHRLYCTMTRDFVTFSDTKLLYDPAFSVIDATFVRKEQDLYMVIKDERLKPEHKYLQWLKAESPTGPFGPLSQPFTPSWVEGPTAIKLGDEVVVFFDCYTVNHYGALATRDFKTWRDVSAGISIPEGASHGTIIEIPRALYDRLRA